MGFACQYSAWPRYIIVKKVQEIGAIALAVSCVKRYVGGMTNKFKKPISEREDEAMVRLCLKCREAFESHWAGERVCKTCKSRDEWRTGGGYEAA